MAYKNIWAEWENVNKDGKKYHKLRNVSGQRIITEPGEDIFLNETSPEVMQKHPTLPHFQKSIKIEEEPKQEDIITPSVDPDDLPF